SGGSDDSESCITIRVTARCCAYFSSELVDAADQNAGVAEVRGERDVWVEAFEITAKVFSQRAGEGSQDDSCLGILLREVTRAMQQDHCLACPCASGQPE